MVALGRSWSRFGCQKAVIADHPVQLQPHLRQLLLGGRHPHQVADAFDAAVRRSGQPTIRFHDLRHTWATFALRAGVSPKIVSERLGHAKVGFTLDTYAHATPGWQAEAAATVAGLVFGGRS